MLIDVGGKYMDLDDNRQFLDVIQMKISYQFAEEIGKRIESCCDKLMDTELELDLEAATSAELREALKHIEMMAWREKQKAIAAGVPDKIIELFREIEDYAGQYN